MVKCKKCLKLFLSDEKLEKHQTKNSNCDHKCPICLKRYSTKQVLQKHESVACIQRYECNECDKNYKSKYSLKYHDCKKPIIEDKNTDLQNILQNNLQNNQFEEILKKALENKQLIVNINNNNNNNNNKIGNKKIINKINNKINFTETKPYYFEQDKYEGDKHREFSKLNEHFDEKMADMYMYEELEFKSNYKEALIFYEKRNLELVGFKMFHDELLKDPNHQNVRIKKSKSGKCFIFKGEWVEVPLQKTITKICSKLCDSLYDKETSVNQFLRLVIASQPKRMSALRKHIETSIIDINNIPMIDQKLIM
jgi:hypothetical protein